MGDEQTKEEGEGGREMERGREKERLSVRQANRQLDKIGDRMRETI